MKVKRTRWLTGVMSASLLLTAAAAVASQRNVDRDVDILRLTPEMAEFLIRHVSPRQSAKSQVSALIDAVFGKKGLKITYQSTATLTAAETFKARQGNCLSFTILFVAMARHLGLDAYFEEVGEVISWDRRGEIVVRNQHMVVEIEVENGHRRVDFLPEESRRYHLVRRISDDRAVAHYHNNLGVDALAKGDVASALEHFERSLAVDETFSHAWTNRGVARRHDGDFKGAERDHLRALEIAPSEPAALANLASLYVAHGYSEKAEPLIRKAEAALARNPFHHDRQGVVSGREESWEEAASHFREAIRRMPEEAEFHTALAGALHRTGELAKARAALNKALALTPDIAERERLKRELAFLGAGS